MTNPILVAVAWPYANGDLHLGHLAGALLPADIFARYHRLRGRPVLKVSGSDAHGTPVTIAADQEGVAPETLFGRYHARFLDTLLALGLTYDLFTHTDTPTHRRVAQDLFLTLHENGYIYRAEQQLWYSTAAGRFLPDRYVEGTCPHCRHPDARGDQCDECGRPLDSLALIDPRSILDGSRPEIRSSEHLFLDLPAFADALLAYLDSHADHWRPNALNFSRNFIRDGLAGRPITRDLSWGIPVPLPGWEEKKLYIWFENVIGYLSASIAWARAQGRPDAWHAWWYDPNARSTYFLGKDNIAFHAITWPAQLLGAAPGGAGGLRGGLNLPFNVAASEFLTIEQRQFSKSRRWAVWLPDLLTRYPPDVIRYAIAATLPESRDGDFSWAEFVRRTNDELVATWGNLVYRVLSFAFKHWGEVPAPEALRPLDEALLADVEAAFTTVGTAIEAVQLRAGLGAAFQLARNTNGYLEQAPWHRVIQSDRPAAATTVYTALQAIDALTVLLNPYLPFSSAQVRGWLGHGAPLAGRLAIVPIRDGDDTHLALVYSDDPGGDRWRRGTLPAGRRLAKPAPLFPKLDPSIAAAELARLRRGHPPTAA